jgi:superoxide dismutase
MRAPLQSRAGLASHRGRARAACTGILPAGTSDADRQRRCLCRIQPEIVDGEKFDSSLGRRNELAQAIGRDFGNVDRCRVQFTEVASTIMGSGWAALVWEPLGKRLLITQIYDHPSNLSQSGVPLIVLDAWEHAYYLQYENRKSEFFEAAWNLWNWPDIALRFEAARKLDMQLPGTTR